MNHPQTQENSPVSSIVKRLITSACCVFTALTLLLLFIQFLTELNLDKSINAAVFLMLLPLSLAIAGAHMIRMSAVIPTGGKLILHPLLCLGGIFLAYLPYMTANHFSAAQVLVHLFFFAVIYGIVTAVLCVIFLATHRRSEKQNDTSYVSQFNFDKKNGKDK